MQSIRFWENFSIEAVRKGTFCLCPVCAPCLGGWPEAHRFSSRLLLPTAVRNTRYTAHVGKTAEHPPLSIYWGSLETSSTY